REHGPRRAPERPGERDRARDERRQGCHQRALGDHHRHEPFSEGHAGAGADEEKGLQRVTAHRPGGRGLVHGLSREPHGEEQAEAWAVAGKGEPPALGLEEVRHDLREEDQGKPPGELAQFGDERGGGRPPDKTTRRAKPALPARMASGRSAFTDGDGGPETATPMGSGTSARKSPRRSVYRTREGRAELSPPSSAPDPRHRRARYAANVAMPPLSSDEQ